jgi:hypothetical protein
MTDSGYIRGTLEIPLLLDGCRSAGVMAVRGRANCSDVLNEYIISEPRTDVSFGRISPASARRSAIPWT